MGWDMTPRELEALRLAASESLTVALLQVIGKYASYEGARDCVNRLAADGLIEPHDFEQCPIVKRWFYRLTDAGRELAEREGIDVPENG